METTTSGIPRLNKTQAISLVIGIVAVVASIAVFVLSGPAAFFHAYLYAYLFWLGIALGCLAIAMTHYLVGGNWGSVIQQVVEAASKTLWLQALLFIPIIVGVRYLYPWANPDMVAADPILQHKSTYLNIPFFIIRAVIYFAIWIFLARQLIRWAHESQYDQSAESRRPFQRMSAIGIILYVLTMTFASTDWIMSLQPDWYSTIFGLLEVSAQILSGWAFALALLPLLNRVQLNIRGSRKVVISTPNLNRDLGALLLTSVMMWAYLAYSQFIIIWWANLPHEVTWYLSRSQGIWLWLGLVIFLVQFALPFMVLISLRAKQNAFVLFILSSAILLTQLLYNYWMIMPVFPPEGLVGRLQDVIIPLAIGGLWFWAFIFHLKNTPQPIQNEELLRAQLNEAFDHEQSGTETAIK